MSTFLSRCLQNTNSASLAEQHVNRLQGLTGFRHPTAAAACRSSPNIRAFMDIGSVPAALGSSSISAHRQLEWPAGVRT